jgi:hypothetical protein
VAEKAKNPKLEQRELLDLDSGMFKGWKWLLLGVTKDEINVSSIHIMFRRPESPFKH